MADATRVDLSGSVPEASGAPFVELSSNGLFLGADGSDVRIPVLEQKPLFYEERTLGDRLQIGTQEYAVPRGKGRRVTEMLAFAQLGVAGAEEGPAGPLLQLRTRIESAFLARWLGENEPLLAWLRTSTTQTIPSDIGRDALVAELRFVLTSRRAALVALTKYGDVRVDALPTQPLTVQRRTGRAKIAVAHREWVSELGNGAHFAWIEDLVGLPESERIRRAAELVLREFPKERAHGKSLLAAAEAAGDRWARLTTTLMVADAPDSQSFADALAPLLDGEAPSYPIEEWWEDFGLSVPIGEAVVSALETQDGARAKSLALRLRSRLHATIVQGTDDRTRAEAVLEHARRLEEGGERAEARALLEETLATLPTVGMLDLVVHEDREPSAVESEGPGLKRPSEPDSRLRVQTLEMLARLRDESGAHVPTLAELARLHPLSTVRLQHLADADSDGVLGQRATRILEIAEAKMFSPPPGWPDAVRRWSEEELESRVRHPVGRSAGAIGAVQSLLAKTDRPDHSSLQSYCERLDGKAHPTALAAVVDACLALGTPGVQAFVSRGERSVGVRAYEGKPHFLLIGVTHLEGSEPLLPAELRFAVGAEIAHLRFGHTRVTSAEVWSGAVDMGVSTLQALVSVLPVVGAWKWGEKIATVAGHAQGVDFKGAMGFAGKMFGKKEDDPVVALGTASSDLVAAHRVMQFTADRAGLVLANDPGAAIRAMFRTWPAYAAELAMVERVGVREVLGQVDEQGAYIYPQLLARVSALLSFYLSDDFTQLKFAESDEETS
ncbi:MAG: hypothetical protein AAGF12_21660 [Myxococcota bacterium]